MLTYIYIPIFLYSHTRIMLQYRYTVCYYLFPAFGEVVTSLAYKRASCSKLMRIELF